MKPISISLNPNAQKDDVSLALRLIFNPRKWRFGSAIQEIENVFKKYLGVKHVIFFNSGRSSLMAILAGLELPKGSEVMLQAFTCNAASNPIIWSGYEPVYVDCDKDSFNIDMDDLKRKIGPNSKVLMVQHTFGLPANIDQARAICEQNNITLIEDCAHALGAEYGSTLRQSSGQAGSPQVMQKVGTFGKASFFSFGRDKIISSVWGGVVATNDDELARKIKEFQLNIPQPPNRWVLQQLLHPVLMYYIILPLYNVFDLGKIFLVLSQWFSILSKAVHWKEKKGIMPSYFPKRFPNALAILALHQFKKLDKFNTHRKELADFYSKELKELSFELPKEFSGRENIFLRYTIKHPKAHEIIYEAWHKQNILVGDWYTSPIIPSDTDLQSVRYKLGSCPIAEKLAKTTFNLPTHINVTLDDARIIVDFLKKYGN